MSNGKKPWPRDLNPLEMTSSQLREMRMLGYDKPPGITYAEYVGATDEGLESNPKHSIVLHLAAAGFTQKKIAEEVGYTTARVHQLLGTQEAKEIVRQIQEKHFGENTHRRIKQLVDVALRNFEQVLENEEERAQVRLDAAKYILDQHIGKATQKVEVQGNMINNLLVQIDQLSKSEAAKEFIDVTPRDEIDDFLEQNIQQLTVGERDRGQNKASKDDSQTDPEEGI